MGPYATPNILSAMAVAERHGYVLPQHTAVIAPLLTYECQFPAWSIGPTPNEFVPNQLFDAVATPAQRRRSGSRSSTNQNGSTDFVSYGVAGRRQDPGVVSIAEERGLEVVAEIRYPPTTTDWAPIADAGPGRRARPRHQQRPRRRPGQPAQAMEQLDYQPPLMFSLFPAPGPPLGARRAGRGPAVGLALRAERARRCGPPAPRSQAIVEEFESTRDGGQGLPYTDVRDAGGGVVERLGDPRRRRRRPRATSTSRRSATRCTARRGHDVQRPARPSTRPANNFWPTDQLHQADPERRVGRWSGRTTGRRRSSRAAS